MSNAAIEQLEPQRVWSLFAEMSQIPRPSKKEARIRAHVQKVAEAHSFATRTDDIGNLVIIVPASPGYEQAPVTVIQGHLDMVCEKNSGTDHDFERDPLALVIDHDGADQIVRASGTTLGADNGIGVCMALAAAIEPDVVHGPLEILCTIDEEAGMSGAKALTPDLFSGRRLINLDSEEDHVIYIGCAGGTDVNLSWSLPMSGTAQGVNAYSVSVSGLKGGHSGCDIHLNRGNAIKALVHTLRHVGRADMQVSAIEGGRLRNAIPREASAIVVGPSDLGDKLKATASDMQAQLRRDNGEASATIEVVAVDNPEMAISQSDSQQILRALAALPSGVQAVVPEIAGLVQTSNNLSSVVSSVEGTLLSVRVGCLARSSSDDDMHNVVCQIKAVGKLAGAEIKTGNEYPGWKPDTDSKLLGTCRQLYSELFGEPPNVTAIHAGLECGIIGERVSGMDMISFGPRIEGAHSPDERVYVESVRKSWRMLVAVLKALAKG